METQKIKVGIVGGTGYTGVELIRLLHEHPQFELEVVTSRAEKDMPLSDVFPNFINCNALYFSEPLIENLEHCDLVFFATPNGTAMTMAPELLDKGVRVIDLAADFRLRDVVQWERWYGVKHACAGLLKDAVYGLPEMHREQIRQARLVANPGCYPTAVTLGLLPLIRQGLIETSCIVADAKSGVSGAGRSAKIGNLHAEVSESFKAYAIAGHRHQPEIEQQLCVAGDLQSVGLTFVPHLLPMNRGIEATLYVTVKRNQADWHKVFRDHYSEEPFVTVLDDGKHPETRAVRGSNYCHLSVFHLKDDRVVVSSVIDNLVKGAAGQAIQNANLMFGLDETEGLRSVGMLP